jgi:hypothetical protein
MGIGAQKEPSLLDQLKAGFGLVKTTPSEPSILDDWWEGRLEGRVVAFQERPDGLMVHLGQIEEITEIYLARVGAGQPLPAEGSPQRLDRIVGRAGAALASQFCLAAHPPGEFDYPQLRLPALRDGIPRFSPSVQEILVYERCRGLSLITDQTATRESLEEDLTLAMAMLEELEVATI